MRLGPSGMPFPLDRFSWSQVGFKAEDNTQMATSRQVTPAQIERKYDEGENRVTQRVTISCFLKSVISLQRKNGSICGQSIRSNLSPITAEYVTAEYATKPCCIKHAEPRRINEVATWGLAGRRGFESRPPTVFFSTE
jgi:hypothetical protein